MFKHILVPLDGSEFSERILLEVERLLHMEDARVTLVRVVEPRRGEQAHEYQTRKDGVQVYLDRHCSTLSEQGTTADGILLEGDAAGEILDAVAADPPSLVAMSTHGRSGPSRWIRGSVAERILRNCSVPLLLINPENPEKATEVRFQRLLVPLDGSDRSAAILPEVKALAQIFDSTVVLYHVSWITPDLSDIPGGVVPAAGPHTLEEGKLILDPFAQDLLQAGLKVETDVTFGLEAAEIVNKVESGKINLVMMTTHARTGLDRWMLGSVAENVLRHSSCPVYLKRMAGCVSATASRHSTVATDR